MVLLEPDPFLNELNKLFERNKGKGTVFVTMKRSSLKPRRGKAKVPQEQHRCLVRATDGKRKISTTLSAEQHVRFQASYALILRAHMDSLKKREKVRVKPQQQQQQGGGGGGGGK